MNEAVVPRNLSVLAYAQGFTLWHYKIPEEHIKNAPDAFRQSVERDFYFQECEDMFFVGDIIMISSSAGGKIYFVSKNGEGQIEIHNMVN